MGRYAQNYKKILVGLRREIEQIEPNRTNFLNDFEYDFSKILSEATIRNEFE